MVLIRNILLDSLVDQTDFVNWVSEDNTVTAHLILLDHYIETKQANLANMELTWLNQQTEEETEESERLAKLIEVKEIEVSRINVLGVTTDPYTVTDRNILETIAQNEVNSGGDIARNIMNFYYNGNHYVSPCLPSESGLGGEGGPYRGARAK